MRFGVLTEANLCLFILFFDILYRKSIRIYCMESGKNYVALRQFCLTGSSASCVMNHKPYTSFSTIIAGASTNTSNDEAIKYGHDNELKCIKLLAITRTSK